MVDKPAAESVSLDHIRYTSGASLSPDATAFACLVDDGGYPRAVQRFLEGRRTTSARSVELPVDGPITRVIHSADGHWLACQVSPHGGNRPQVWVVTTDPDDRAARMLGTGDDCAVELIGWDGTLVAVTGTDEEGVSEARLVNPHTQAALILDRRVGGRLVDSWRGDAGDGSSLLRVGPRGNRELLLLRGDAKTPLLPADPGSSTRGRDHPRRPLPSAAPATRTAIERGVRRPRPRRPDPGEERLRLRVRPPARGGVLAGWDVVPGARRAGRLRTRRVHRQRRHQHRRAAVERQRLQRTADPAPRGRLAGSADRPARSGRERAEHQRRRVDAGCHRRGPGHAAVGGVGGPAHGGVGAGRGGAHRRLPDPAVARVPGPRRHAAVGVAAPRPAGTGPDR